MIFIRFEEEPVISISWLISPLGWSNIRYIRCELSKNRVQYTSSKIYWGLKLIPVYLHRQKTKRVWLSWRLTGGGTTISWAVLVRFWISFFCFYPRHRLYCYVDHIGRPQLILFTTDCFILGCTGWIWKSEEYPEISCYVLSIWRLGCIVMSTIGYQTCTPRMSLLLFMISITEPLYISAKKYPHFSQW